MMKKNKKLFYLLGLIPIIAVPSIIASCTNNETKSRLAHNFDYDFAIATSPLNSLNYLKYNSVGRIVFSLVEGLFKEAPSTNSKIGNVLGLHKLNVRSYVPNAAVTTIENMTGSDFIKLNPSSSIISVSEFNLNTGVISADLNNTYYPFINLKNADNKIIATKFTLNFGASKWSDGKTVVAQDFIDAMEYILDLNTGSQLRAPLLDFNIKGSRAMNEAQENYIRKHGVPYQNPFGRKPYIFNKENNEWIEDQKFEPFQNQKFDANNNPVDTLEVNAIKKAALNMGWSTGRVYNEISNDELKEYLKLKANANFKLETSDFIFTKENEGNENNQNKIKLTKNRYFLDKQVLAKTDLVELATTKDLLRYEPIPRTEYELMLEYESYAPKPNEISLINSLIYAQFLLPANRKYIETHGGIHKFGSEISNFVTNGPFVLSEGILGPEGYLLFEKNKNYYSSNWTLSNKIKIFFNAKEEVKSVWFDEEIISATTVPSSFQFKFWSKPKTRKLMKKNQGVGTVAIQFNLDKQSRYASLEEYEKNKEKEIPILDADLRKALAYAINRENILRLTGFTSSFPVTTWTPFNKIKNSKGENVELWFDGKSVAVEQKDSNNNYIKYPLQNNDFNEHSAKTFNFENIDRSDKMYNVNTALFYLKKYKEKFPNQESVTLKFVYPSQPADPSKAAIAFKDLVERNLNGYVKIDLQALPPNTYLSFINSGKFDISYQNFDRFVSESFETAMSVFLVPDGIEHDVNKVNGFDLNVSGSWTFKDFFDKYHNDQQKLKQVLERLEIPMEHAKIIEELATRKNVKSKEFYNPNNLDTLKFGKTLNHLDAYNSIFNYFVNKEDKDKIAKLKNEDDINEILKRSILLSEEIFSNNKDKKLKIKLKGVITKQELEVPITFVKKMTDNWENNLDLNKFGITNFSDWNKKLNNRYEYEFIIPKNALIDTFEVYDLVVEENNQNTSLISSYINDTDEVNPEIFATKKENYEIQRQRIQSFFSGNRVGWNNESEIFDVIASMEKILREEMPIMPIMDSDTFWNISSLGGTPNHFTYFLQFSYDYRNPPIPGLPTSPDEEEI